MPMLRNSNDAFPLKLNLYKDEFVTKSLKISLSKLDYFISHQSDLVNEFYRTKKDGISKRLIQHPLGEYKLLLKRMNKLVLKRSHFDKSVIGGITNKNLLDMVQKHCGKEAVFQIDLQDFFPNIFFDRVYSLFRNSNCADDIALKFARLVTFQNKIPQGFPTSTTIANLVAYKLDFDQVNICKKVNVTRTRWVDDIVFSGRIKDLEKIAPKIITSVKSNGFIINDKKIKFQRRKNETITSVGLQINKHKPSIPKSLIEEIKDFLFEVGEYGKESAYELYEDYFGTHKKDPLKSIKGKINYIEIYNPNDAKILNDIYQSICQ